MTSPPRPPAPAYLCGSKPGVFDPAQPARLLRYPDSTLLFASFSPLTFSSPSLRTDALPRARRIVVEVPCANHVGERPNFFSFVPNAVLAPGVASEGKWPRVVDYCGRWVVCDQDQWDLHKLDPVYDCFVPTSGMHPTITRKTLHASQNEAQDSGSEPSGADVSVGKTTPAASSTFAASAPSDGNSSSSQSEVNVLSFTFLASSSMLESPSKSIPSPMASEITVRPGVADRLAERHAYMVPSSSAPLPPSATPAGSSEPNIARQGTTTPARKHNVNVNAAPILDPALGALPDAHFITPSPQNAPTLVQLPASSATPSSSAQPFNDPGPNSPKVADDDVIRTSLPTRAPDSHLGKRKTFYHTGADGSDSSSFSSDTWRAQKRPREASPTTLKAEFERKKAQRKRDRERAAEVFEGSAMKKLDDQFWSAEIVASVVENSLNSVRSGHGGHEAVPERHALPASASTVSGPDLALSSGQPASQPQDGHATQFVPERHAPPASASTVSGPDLAPPSGSSGQPAPLPEANARSDDNPTHQATCQPAVAEDVTTESRRGQAATDARARAQAFLAYFEPENRQPMQEQVEQRMPWTPRRAIERYLTISQQFDTARFSPANPVDLVFIPWPVLHPPSTHQLARIDWQTVEAFFEEASRHMCVDHYKAFIFASRKRFHPDRWRSRGVVSPDDTARSQFLERACTIISQVIGPIWDTVRFLEAEAD